MAKKDPTDLSVEERLKTLFQLQQALSAIDEKKALRGELPLEVEDLEAEIEGLNTRIERIESEIGEFDRAISQKKGEIVDAQNSVERYKQQLNEVRNNREYDTLSQSNQNMLQEKQGDLDLKKSELDEIMDETRAEEEKLKEKAHELEAKIEPRLLTSFKRIRKNARNGLGIVYVQRDACGGCFNKIPPQRQLDIKMHKKVIVCEYCGRILIDPELAGVKTEKPATEEKKTTRRRATGASVRKTSNSKKATDANDMI